jgi:glycerophosphoryl diester phosphodiesterase
MICGNVLLIAHRGESHDAPENTLAAINLAWARNADAVEIDVQLSKDGKAVVIHDETTQRTGGSKGKVRDQTLASLRQLDVGGYKDKRWMGERIPTLEEVLGTVPTDKILFVEIKCGPEVIHELESCMRKSPLPPQQVVLIGMELEVMGALKRGLNRHEVCWVCEAAFDKREGRWRPGAEEMVAEAREAGLDGLDVSACDAIDSAFVQAVKGAGMRLYVWTVNEPARAQRLCELGVDGITTDRAAWLRKALE